jgi:glycosyltransferase involved in cell wall biosynthesis
LKIIQISAAYKPAYIYGGPTMSVAKLSEELFKKGVEVRAKNEAEVEVLTTTANGKEELSVPIGKATWIDGVKVTYFKRLTKDHTHFSPALLWALHKKLRAERRKNRENGKWRMGNGEWEKRKTRTEVEAERETLQQTKQLTNQTTNQPTIVHIHAWWNLVSMLSCAVARWHQFPVVLSPRGMLTSYTLGNRNSIAKRMLHGLLGKRLLAYCHIHATSEKEKRDVASNFKVKSITVVPNFVELPKPLPKTELSQSTTFKLIFLSRIEQKKGLELLFEALALLDFDWHLTIAGAGEETYVKSLKLKVESLKLDERINWLGHVGNADKFQLLADHDLMVLTSYNENFANVVIESLAVGTPVLLSKEVGLATYVRENNLGWVCDLDKGRIAESLNESYLSEEKRDSLRTDAPLRIREDFEEKELVKRYLKMYEVLGN